MKYLVLFAVLLVAYVWWRQTRLEAPRRENTKTPGPAAPQDMVRCALCGLHLPRPEAVSGNDGRLYCCQEHRQSAAGGP